ncbi:MAG TPA: hypothetical protein VKV26_14015 [Dehalococcoidia bacterium]|nr:hypothetical protein [Dehalococcoidia bacterium]
MSIAQGSLAEVETLLTLCEQIGWFPAGEAANPRHDAGDRPYAHVHAPKRTEGKGRKVSAETSSGPRPSFPYFLSPTFYFLVSHIVAIRPRTAP